MTTPGWDGERLSAAARAVLNGQCDHAAEQFADCDFCVAAVTLAESVPAMLAHCEALETALREKVAEWRGMIGAAEAEGPIVGDESGHASRWEMARIFTDELRALLSDGEQRLTTCQRCEALETALRELREHEAEVRLQAGIFSRRNWGVLNDNGNVEVVPGLLDALSVRLEQAADAIRAALLSAEPPAPDGAQEG